MTGNRCHLAVVHTPGEVHTVVAASCRRSLMASLAEQLAEEAPVQLWAEDAARFQELLESGNAAGAIELFFARVGSRWDSLRLEVRTVEVD